MPASLLLLHAVLAPPAEAGKRENKACEAIKPAQQLATADQSSLQAQLSVAIAPGSGQGSVDRESSTSFDVKQLEDAALTRSWYTYQLCVMHVSGVIPEGIYEELLRDTWGLSPAATSPEAAAAPSSPDACVEVKARRPPSCMHKRMIDELYWDVMLTNNCGEVVSCLVSATVSTTVDGGGELSSRVEREFRWVKPGKSEDHHLRGFFRETPQGWRCSSATSKLSTTPLEMVCEWPAGAP